MRWGWGQNFGGLAPCRAPTFFTLGTKIMAKKQKSDSATGQVSMFAAAQKGEILPPEHCDVPPEAMPFWRSIIECRAKESWFGHDLEIAADLAKDQLLSRETRKFLDEHGHTNEKGKTRPESRTLAATARRISLYTRLLAINSRAVVGKSVEMQRRRSAEREAEKKMDGIGAHDGLIPTRSH